MDQLKHYLPKNEDKKYVGARVPKSLYFSALEQMKKDRLTWSQVLKACLELFVNQAEKKSE